MYKSRYDNKLLFLFRVNGALPPTALNPHTIFYGYQTLPIKPNIQFNTTNSSGLESLTSVNIPVSINSTFTRDISVNYAVTSSTATSGSDFTLASGTLNIASGDLTNNINLSIINDVNVESSETITITLSSPVFANLGSNTTFIYTILDNDTSTTPRTSNNKSSNRCTSSTPEYDVEITNVEKISTNKIKVYFKDKSKRVTKYDVRYGFSKNNLFFKKGNVAKKGDNNITLHINNLDNVNLYLSIKNNNNCKTGDWSDTYHFKKLNTNSIVTNFVNTIIKPSPTPVPTVKRIEVQKQDNNKNQAVKNIQEKPTVTTKTEPGIFKNIQNFFSNLFN